MRHGQLRDGTRAWLDVEVTGLRVVGQLAPRLELRMMFSTPAAGIATTLKVVQLELLWNEELLGSGLLVEEVFDHRDAHRLVEVPTSRRLLQEITDRLGPAPKFSLQLRFSGSGVVTATSDQRAPARVDDPPGGQPMAVRFDGQNTFSFPVARSDWFEHVVSKLGDSDYIPLELLVPRGTTGEPWRAALTNLDAARRSYALGDDAAVFFNLRGALDALPGAKQNIFAKLPEPKRTEIDKLVSALGQFLHTGRHVTEETGTFPVDHIDAGFALNLMEVLLSYASRALEAASTR